MGIEVSHVTKRFGRFAALQDVSLVVPSGELVALLGPSGSGKTTLLRIMAGLEVPDEGSVWLDGTDITNQSARARRVGFVFQHYALFRHMTVFENVAFGLRVRPRHLRPSEAEIRERVYALLRLVQMEWLADRYPSQLSGGQRQRVALARALAVEPRVLLLDEPFGSLDARVRQELRRWLRRLHDQIQLTSVFVTHDQEEALEVADRVVIMNSGRIEQIGTPEEVYEDPASPFVFQFLGRVNLFRGRTAPTEGDRAGPGAQAVGLSSGEDGSDLVVGVRPHDVEIDREATREPSIEATVLRARLLGSIARVELRRLDSGELLEAELTRSQYRQLALRSGERVHAVPRNVRVFSAGTATAIEDGQWRPYPRGRETHALP